MLRRIAGGVGGIFWESQHEIRNMSKHLLRIRLVDCHSNLFDPLDSLDKDELSFGLVHVNVPGLALLVIL